MQPKNKRGFILTTAVAAIAAVLIILVVIGLLIFINANTFAVIGGGMIALSLIFGLRGEFNQTKAIFLGIIIISGLVFLVLGTEQIAYGYSSLSVSRVNIIDGGERIRIYGVANGAEAIRMYIDNSDVNDFIEGEGYKMQEDKDLYIKLNDPKRSFNIQRDVNKNFVGAAYYEIKSWQQCTNNLPYYLDADDIVTEVIGVFNRLCIYDTSYGTYSYFTGEYKDDTPVTLTVDGDSKTINPGDGERTASLKGGDVQIEWTGNLVNTVGLSKPSYAVLYTDSRYAHLIDGGAWNSYQNDRTNFVNKLNEPWDINDAKQIVQEYNNQINSILVERTTQYQRDINSNIELTSNAMEVELKSATVFPTFIITMDADEVGLIQLSGKPSIQDCADDVVINSGDTYRTDIRVKNIGNTAGTFYGTISCSGDSNVDGTVGQRLVEAGQTVSIPIDVSGVNTEDGIDSNRCTVTIKDLKNERNSATCRFNIGVEYIENLVCAPFSTTCQDINTLKVCNDKGTGFQLLSCEEGCITFSDGSSQCIVDECSSDAECEDNQECVEGVCKEEQLTCDKWYQEPGITTTYKYNILGIKFGAQDNPACKTAIWFQLALIGTFVILLVAVVLLLNPKKNGKK